MSEQNKVIKSQVEDDEIDLIALAKTLWNGRKTVIKTTLIFMGIGLFVAVFSEKEYTASTTFVPQTSDGIKIGGNLGGLAAMAGINLGSMGGGSGISPSLYSEIFGSVIFQKELLETPLTFKGQNEKISFSEYYLDIHSPGLFGYLKDYTIGLPGKIIKALKSENSDEYSNTNNQLIIVTKDEQKLIKQLSKQMILDVNDEDEYISISANMPESIASAELVIKAQNLLQQYIINLKIQKSAEQLNFIQERYDEKESNFQEIQQKLARFRDQNQYINSSLAKTTLEGLQSEYELAYGVYSELAKQLETQKIQVKENTPVFMILNPVSVPLEKSKPKRPLILLIWTFFGGIIGIGLVYGKEFIIEIKEKWEKH